jgi:hypothetical protein
MHSCDFCCRNATLTGLRGPKDPWYWDPQSWHQPCDLHFYRSMPTESDRRPTMNWKRIVPSLVLLIFSVDTAMILAEHGLVGFFELVFANTATLQVFGDLVIALVLVTIWMVADARKLGRNVWPFVILTLGLGSIGPLAYLSTRSTESAASHTNPNVARRQTAT